MTQNCYILGRVPHVANAPCLYIYPSCILSKIATQQEREILLQLTSISLRIYKYCTVSLSPNKMYIFLVIDFLLVAKNLNPNSYTYNGILHIILQFTV